MSGLFERDKILVSFGRVLRFIRALRLSFRLCVAPREGSEWMGRGRRAAAGGAGGVPYLPCSISPFTLATYFLTRRNK